MTREGRFLFALWQAMFPDGHMQGNRLPPARRLLVSRLSTFAASLAEPTLEELMRLWSLYRTQSLASLLKSLGCSVERYRHLAQRHNIDASLPVYKPWLCRNLRSFLNDADVKKLLSSEIADKRCLLDLYLAQLGWEHSTLKVALVDIGWRGSIQDNLSLLRPQTHTHGFYLGLQRFCNRQSSNTTKCAYGPNLNYRHEHGRLLQSVSPLEMLCLSDEGSVISYHYDTTINSVQPCCVSIEAERKAFFSYSHYFQRGVLSRCQYWSQHTAQDSNHSIQLLEEGIQAWVRLIRRPSTPFAMAHASLKHNEVFGLGTVTDMRDVPSIDSILLGVVSRKVRHKNRDFVYKHQWPQGLVARSDLGYVHKLMLLTLFAAERGWSGLRGLIARAIRDLMSIMSTFKPART